MSLRGGFGEEVQKERLRFLTLALGGLKETAQHAVIFESLFGARALDDFAHDDHRTQTLLGLVVGRWNPGTPKAGEEQFLSGPRAKLGSGSQLLTFSEPR